jgi:hypothetical protein
MIINIHLALLLIVGSTEAENVIVDAIAQQWTIWGFKTADIAKCDVILVSAPEYGGNAFVIFVFPQLNGPAATNRDGM